MTVIECKNPDCHGSCIIIDNGKCERVGGGSVQACHAQCDGGADPANTRQRGDKLYLVKVGSDSHMTIATSPVEAVKYAIAHAGISGDRFIVVDQDSAVFEVERLQVSAA